MLVVETFVDPAQFCGPVYTANGWQELGRTDGWGRCQRDYYVQHDHPKRLFVRALVKNACRSLQAEPLKPALASVEKKAGVRCYHKSPEIQALTEQFKALPDYCGSVESYPVWSLATLMLLALLCDAPRGQKDLAKLARRLTQAQRRALGIRPDPHGRFPAPSQSTFSRLRKQLDARRLNQVLLDIQAQVRGQPPSHELIAVDGKEPRPGPGDAILRAVTLPSQVYLGSALGNPKTNEIPVARERFGKLDLAGRWGDLDALPTQDETARQLVLAPGAHYLLTVKNNQPTLRQNIEKLVPVPPTDFSPLAPTPTQARTVEQNQGAAESRTLEACAVAAENLGFPFAAQAAQVTRQRAGRKDEPVGLITDLTPAELSPRQWLQANRHGWGIENGSPRRLEVALNDDRCRVRSPNGLWILGLMRRLVISLFLEWRGRQRKPHFQSLSDFQAPRGKDKLTKALGCVTHQRPTL